MNGSLICVSKFKSVRNKPAVVHSQEHSHTHTHTHTQSQSFLPHIILHTHTHTGTHSQFSTTQYPHNHWFLQHTHMHVCTHARTHTHTCAHTARAFYHTRPSQTTATDLYKTHTYTHTHTHTHACTCTHTCSHITQLELSTTQYPHRLQPQISTKHTHTQMHTQRTCPLTIIARFTVTRVAMDKVCALPMATRVRSAVIDVVLTERAGKARQTLTAGLSRWHPTASAVVLTRIFFFTNVYLLTLTACTWRGYKIDEIYVHKLNFFF